MSFEIWLAFIIASAIVCFTPGPTTLLVLSQVMKHGKKSVLPLVVGTECGNIVAMSLSFLGMGAVLATSATLFTIMKFLGAAYLIYMGITAIKHKETNIDITNQHVPKGNIFKNIFLVNSLNPKTIMFFIAFFPMFINSETPIIPQMLILALSFMSVSISTVIVYSVFSNVLRTRFTSIAFRNKLNKFTGGMLISAGLITASLSK